MSEGPYRGVAPADPYPFFFVSGVDDKGGTHAAETLFSREEEAKRVAIALALGRGPRWHFRVYRVRVTATEAEITGLLWDVNFHRGTRPEERSWVELKEVPWR